jgi:hypothetical protein
VEFFAQENDTNNVLIGESLNSPYLMNWVTPGAGSYNITAVAFDTNGMSATSGSINIQVLANQAPIPINDTYTVLANSANNVFNPLVNNTDPYDYPLTITALSSLGVTNSSITTYNGGTATIINSGRAISYTPPFFLPAVTGLLIGFQTDTELLRPQVFM